MRKRGSLSSDSRERAWWVLVLAVLAVLGLACWFALFFGRNDLGGRKSLGTPGKSASGDSLRNQGEGRQLEAASPSLSARAVYAYSVIPGGIRSVADLKAAIARDPVVSAEYANFRLQDARIVPLDRGRSVHLAYRFGSRVFWTSRRVTIEKGETVITDGVETARTKCGNLISEELKAPVTPNEPTELVLNTPIAVRYDPGGPETDDRFPELLPPPPASALPPSYESPVSEPPFNNPPVYGNPWSGGGEPIMPPPPPPIVRSQGTPPPSPPVINTPEPGTGPQLLVAAVAIFFFLAWRAKAGRRLEANGGTR